MWDETDYSKQADGVLVPESGPLLGSPWIT
jgi:hypothetical protein